MEEKHVSRIEREWKARDKRNQTLSLAFPIKTEHSTQVYIQLYPEFLRDSRDGLHFISLLGGTTCPRRFTAFLMNMTSPARRSFRLMSTNGSRFSGTIDTIKELEPDATVVEDGFTVSERDVAEASEDVAEWLNGLGY